MPSDSSEGSEKHLSKFRAILAEKCPHCREGNMFVHSVFHPGFTKMYEFCPVCSQKFEIEVGFWWGSMYISYAITVLISLAAGIATNIFLKNPSALVYIVIIATFLILLSPIVFRHSRVLMLYYFGSVHFEPGAKLKAGNKSTK